MTAIDFITKLCKKCGAVKSLEEYHKHHIRKDGHIGWCKKCANKRNIEYNKKRVISDASIKRRKEYIKKYNIKNKERLRINTSEYYIKNKETIKNKVIENRKKNIEYYREYDRKRGNRQSLDDLKRYRKENPEAYKAHNAVSNAVRDGRLIKPNNCTKCGKGGIIHGHHKDYSKPLDVIWLCPVCHKAEHKNSPTQCHPSPIRMALA